MEFFEPAQLTDLQTEETIMCLYSRMYKLYYPIQSCDDLDLMSMKERSLLATWINDFYYEMVSASYSKWKKGLDWSFDLLDQFSQTEFESFKKKLIYKIPLNELETKTVLQILNTVLYRHKYNAFLSHFICPVWSEHTATGGRK